MPTVVQIKGDCTITQVYGKDSDGDGNEDMEFTVEYYSEDGTQLQANKIITLEKIRLMVNKAKVIILVPSKRKLLVSKQIDACKQIV